MDIDIESQDHRSCTRIHSHISRGNIHRRGIHANRGTTTSLNQQLRTNTHKRRGGKPFVTNSRIVPKKWQTWNKGHTIQYARYLTNQQEICQPRQSNLHHQWQCKKNYCTNRQSQAGHYHNRYSHDAEQIQGNNRIKSPFSN